MKPQSRSRESTLSFPTLAAASLCTGILAGLLEGLLLLSAQHFDLLTWNMKLIAVSPRILWVSAVFDALLFLVVAFPLFAMLKLVPRLEGGATASFIFGWMTFFAWISVLGTGRLSHTAMVFLSAGLASVFTRALRTRPGAPIHLMRRALPVVALLPVALWGGLAGYEWWTERRAIHNLPPAAPGTPNILLIIVDALRADHLSAYGYARPTSPNIDRLAGEGILFENAIATSSWTLPSHASMLTGLLPSQAGALENPLSPCAPVLSSRLQESGYRTAAISANTLFFSKRWGFGRGIHHFEDGFEKAGDMAYRTIYGRKIEQFLLRRIGYEEIPGRRNASEITDAAIRWIQKDPAKPFLVGLNYFDAHDPYLPPQPYRGKFSRTANPGGIINSFHLRSGKNLTAEQIQGEVDAYDGAVSLVDAEIGRLIAELSHQGWAENTILIITSDHGESFGEHQLFIHGDGLFRELVHVPLILHWSDRLPSGLRIREPASLAAIPSTLMDLIDKTTSTAFPWPSVRTAWESVERPENRPWPASQLMKGGVLYSLIRDEWQYIRGPGDQEQLYSWLQDPGQLTNLAAHPGQAVRIAEFREHLKKLNAQAVPECTAER